MLLTFDPFNPLSGLYDILLDVFGRFFLDIAPKAVLYLILALLAEVVLKLFAWVFFRFIGDILSANTPIIFFKDNHASAPVQYVIEHLAWYTMFVFVVSIIIVGIRMMFSRNNYTNFKHFIRGIFVYTISCMTLIQIVVLCIDAGDGFSKWIIDDTGINGNIFSTIDVKQLANVDNLESGIFTIFLAIISFIGVILAMFEWLIMYARAGLLGLLIAFLPFAGAISVTSTGLNYFKKIVAWILAFLIYKPVCAIIFAYCIELLKSFPDMHGEIVATATFFICLFSLSAIIQLVSPIQGFNASGSSFASSIMGLGAGALAGGMMGGGKAASGAAEKGGEAAGAAAGGGGGSGSAASGALNGNIASSGAQGGGKQTQGNSGGTAFNGAAGATSTGGNNNQGDGAASLNTTNAGSGGGAPSANTGNANRGGVTPYHTPSGSGDFTYSSEDALTP